MQSETIGALAAALAKAQGEIHPAPMDRDNPYFKSKYATLTSLWESARAALAKNGLAVTQVTDFDNGGDLILITTLLHSSGEWIGGVYPVRGKDTTPQATGSALTYARRYAFGALVGLTSDDDDDGNAAQNGANGGAQQQNKPAVTGKTNGSGAPVEQDDDTKRFHALGVELYGSSKEWDAKRPDIVDGATKGRTKSSKDLTPAELAQLTKILDGRVQAKRAELTAITIKNVDELDYNAAPNGEVYGAK